MTYYDKNTVKLSHEHMKHHLETGNIVIDATAGRGRDTLFLSELVGDEGHVYAFDIQEEAINSTKSLMEENGKHNYTLILDSHHNVKKYVDVPIKAGMFNLGYLPGSDKKVTTMRSTTLPAIQAAIELMDKDAIILIAVYPGHKEGELEGEEICEMLSKLSRYTAPLTLSAS